MSDKNNVSYASDAEVEALVARFASCELPPDEVSHPVHVAMSAWCFLRLPEDEAAARVYDDLRRYVKHHDIKIYNETMTRFWTRLIASAVAGMDRERPAFAIVNDVVARLGNSRMIFAYYPPEWLQTEEARRLWVEPDLRPLDF